MFWSHVRGKWQIQHFNEEDSQTFPRETWWCQSREKLTSGDLVLRADCHNRRFAVFILISKTFFSGRIPNFSNVYLSAWRSLPKGCFWAKEEEEGEKEEYGSKRQSCCPQKPWNKCLKAVCNEILPYLVKACPWLPVIDMVGASVGKVCRRLAYKAGRSNFWPFHRWSFFKAKVCRRLAQKLDRSGKIWQSWKSGGTLGL